MRRAKASISAFGGWYKLNDEQKTAIQDLKEHGYVILSMSQQVSFFSQSANETFNRSVDSLINEVIEMVNEDNRN